MKQFVYIASTGYSGTTLLDMLLNNHPDITALGEVYLLSVYAKNDKNCTCNKAVKDCDFWNRIEAKLKDVSHDPDLNFSSYPLTVEEKVQNLNRKIPSLNDFLLLLGNRILWRTCSGLSSLSRGYMNAAKNTVQLFQAASDVEGTSVIVDSSKYALPLKALYLTSPLPVKILYMVRDGRAVCRTLKRRHEMTYEQAARYWVRYNWNLKLIMMTIPKKNVKLIRYEDLCTDIEKELNDIFDFIGIDKSVSKMLNKNESHTIGGNPMRFRREESEIHLDEKWKDEITAEEKALFESIAGKMNRSLGYK